MCYGFIVVNTKEELFSYIKDQRNCHIYLSTTVIFVSRSTYIIYHHFKGVIRFSDFGYRIGFTQCDVFCYELWHCPKILILRYYKRRIFSVSLLTLEKSICYQNVVDVITFDIFYFTVKDINYIYGCVFLFIRINLVLFQY